MDTPSSDPGSATGSRLSDDWCAHHFDYLAPDLALDLHETLATMRAPVPRRAQRPTRRLLGRHRLRGRPPGRPGLADVQLRARCLGTRETLVARRHPRARRPAVAPELQAGDQPLLHRGRRGALRGSHPRPRHPAHRRLHRARLVRLHGRLRPPVPRPRLLRPGAERARRSTLGAQRQGGRGLDPHQPARPGGRHLDVRVDHRLRRDAAVGATPRRRRRRDPGGGDRRPAHHRHRDRRDDPAPHPGRPRNHRGLARSDHDPLHP